jgi:diguanylate cyclase (GGDEF)-like protein
VNAYPAGWVQHEDAMKEPNERREIGPRIGSPPWIYSAVVTLAGLSVLAAAGRTLSGPELSGPGLPGLASQPLLWVIAAVSLASGVKPLATPGKSLPDAGTASATFCFAALLYWGFPVAAVLWAGTTLLAAIAGRKLLHRAAFSIAQSTLGLAAGAAVLAAAGVHPSPARPWVPAGADLGLVALAAVAYFAGCFLLAGMDLGISRRAPLLATLRAALPQTAFVSFALLSAAPLVVVAMNRSAAFVLLFVLPLAAIHVTAAMSVKREHQALHDQLTGLPNRALLLRRTTEALAQAARSGSKAGLLLLDLDRFKEVNDTLGHPLGDSLLEVVARRLARSVRPGDVVARLGGDEFAVLLPAVRTGTAAREVAARLRAALAEPVRLEGMSLQVEASVGIALFPDDGGTVEVLLQRADVAMYLAKERRSGMECYVARADQHSPARLSLLGDLRRGIDQGEFELHYQPKVFLDSGRTAGMEALIRWRHPRRGRLLPAQFIPLAEQSFLIRDLTGHVLRTALGQVSAWQRTGLPVQLSVNISVRDLVDAGLAALIERELAARSLPPEVLLLEVSERMLTGTAADIEAGAAALHSLGVQLSLDDFGTGYSSLGRLQRMRIAEVKIDPSFVSALASKPGNELIVRSLVGLVRGLGIRCVAEGVESAEVAAALRAIGCDAAQGREFSRPLDVAAATTWLAAEQAAGPLAAATPAPVTATPAPACPGAGILD